MKTKALHILIMAGLVSSGQGLNAQTLDFSGFIDSYHAVRLRPPNDFMSSRSRLRAELKANQGNSWLFASLNANHNYLLPSRTCIELREAYFDYTAKNWDLRIGRQIIIWGVSDGLRITDLISPLDLTEFLARDYDDIRIPVDAVKWRYMDNVIKLELVFIPIFQTYIIPDDPDNPWAITYPSDGPEIIVAPAIRPEKSLKNSEIGGRLSFYLPGFDLSVSGLYTWNKLPVYERNFTPAHDTLVLVPNHFRYSMVGLDFSRPQGSFVIRGEGAMYSAEPLSTDLLNQTNPVLKKTTMSYLVGLDWYPGSNWTLTGQFSQKLILLWEDQLEDPKNTKIATLGITRKLFRSTLSASAFGYIDLTNKGMFARTSLDYSLSDQIHLIAGVDIFHGDAGIFGAYKNNSEFFIKAKYNF
jgi:hypothetical protein